MANFLICALFAVALVINRQVHGNQPTGLKSVSTGGHGTWATDANDGIWYLKDDGNWQKTNGLLKQLSVSSRTVWGVNSGGRIYYSRFKAPTVIWILVPGALVQISASENGNVYGVNRAGHIFQSYKFLSFRGTSYGWRRIPGFLVQISSGPSGVWGVNKDDMIFYLDGTYGDKNIVSNSWIKIDGRLKWIKSGPGYVYGVNKANQAWIRYTSASNPTGGKWHQMHTRHFEL